MKQTEIFLNEKSYKCSFGLGFLGECLENLNLSVTEIGEKLDKNPFKWIPELMFECVKYSNEIDFDKKQMLEWLDNDEDANVKLSEFLKSFLESLTKDVPKEKGNKRSNAKKK